jgi:hypothetical protein
VQFRLIYLGSFSLTTLSAQLASQHWHCLVPEGIHLITFEQRKNEYVFRQCRSYRRSCGSSFSRAPHPGRKKAEAKGHTDLEIEAGAYETFYKRVAEALLDGGALPVAPAEARNVTAVLEAARRSATERRACMVL